MPATRWTMLGPGRELANSCSALGSSLFALDPPLVDLPVARRAWQTAGGRCQHAATRWTCCAPTPAGGLRTPARSDGGTPRSAAVGDTSEQGPLSQPIGACPRPLSATVPRPLPGACEPLLAPTVGPMSAAVGDTSEQGPLSKPIGACPRPLSETGGPLPPLPPTPAGNLRTALLVSTTGTCPPMARRAWQTAGGRCQPASDSLERLGPGPGRGLAHSCSDPGSSLFAVSATSRTTSGPPRLANRRRTLPTRQQLAGKAGPRPQPGACENLLRTRLVAVRRLRH